MAAFFSLLCPWDFYELKLTSPEPHTEVLTNQAWNSRHAMFIVSCVVLLCLLPFIGKPVHVDDALFVWMARQIRAHPLDPYGLPALNWYGTPWPFYWVPNNPPLTSYYLAAASLVGGWSEYTLHTAMLLPALSCVVGTYQLAKRLCNHPALATAMAAWCPVCIVSSTTLMVDVMMLNFFIWAIVAWIDGVRHDRQRYFAVSALLIIAAEMSKYFGASLIPLLAVYTIAMRRGSGWLTLLWLLLPLTSLAAFELCTTRLYGTGMLHIAFLYASVERISAHGPGKLRLLPALSFIGGCLLTIVPAAIWAHCLWTWRSRWRWWIYAAALLILLATFWFGLPPIKKFFEPRYFSALVWTHLIIFTFCGVSLVALPIIELVHWPDPDVMLIALVVLGTTTFTAFLNWSVSARNILPVPAFVAITAVRCLERAKAFENRSALRRCWIATAALLPVSLSVAYADASMARAAQQASNEFRAIAQSRNPSVVWFQGHWGFQYYMRQWGAREIDLASTRCAPGDLLIIAWDNTNPPSVPAQSVKRLSGVRSWQPSWVASIHRQAMAGFYSDVFGPLPFAFGPVHPDRYDVYECTEEVAFHPKQ
jgi:hypothetical protein